ncbi:hypothetical protein L1987_30724 [Smallanthus sonchifolius]|uniref:Uncharacterized protein n=1 Tax=Smallanthus sonchifolius TaxID=185202 RepID=A0ACB9I544_9ASTR|nr:hypothetical protein L1987_30724 [Smallanthus sonchifolius]
MVLFEVLCGRLCYVRDSDGILLLADVAKEYYANDKLDNIIDPVLREQMSEESFKKYSAIAYKCLQDREHRLLMGVVKKELEETLKLQTSTYLAFPISLSPGGCISWKYISNSYVIASRLQIQVWTIHLGVLKLFDSIPRILIDGSIRCTSTRLQNIRCGVASGLRNWSNLNDQYCERHIE